MLGVSCEVVDVKCSRVDREASSVALEVYHQND